MCSAKGIPSHEKRTALSPQRHVANAKLRHCRDARFGGDYRYLGHVKMCSDLVTLEHLRKGEMPDRLSLPSDEIDFLLKIETFVSRKLLDGGSCKFS